MKVIRLESYIEEDFHRLMWNVEDA